jgi:hypothetical protein
LCGSNVNKRADRHLRGLETFSLVHHQFRCTSFIETKLRPLFNGQRVNRWLSALLGVRRRHPIESLCRCLDLLPVPNLVQSGRHWARVLYSGSRRREISLHHCRRRLAVRSVNKAVRCAMLLGYLNERLRVVIDLVGRCISIR